MTATTPTEFATVQRLTWAIARAIEPRKSLTVSEWADLHRRLSAKGSAEPGQWRTDRNPPLREPMDCMSARSTVREVVNLLPIQFGKALCLSTPIPTPSGWTTMGEIKPGDIVFGDDGKPTSVIAASRVFHGHDCYKITFSDGEEIIADAGHKWSVIDFKSLHESRKEMRRRESIAGPGRARARVVSGRLEDHTLLMLTHEIAEKMAKARQSRFAVRVAQAIQLPEKQLPVDPYLLGLWLGDGHSHIAAITTMDQEVVDAFSDFDPAPHTHQNGGAASTYGLRNRFAARLSRAGVLKNKHIPQDYLRASAAQRLALLQGILDSDGYSDESGTVEITSSRKELAEGIIELILSLGIKATYRWRQTKCKPSFRITFTATRDLPIFRLRRRIDRLPKALSERGAHMPQMRYIKKIERVETVPTRCIAVDNASHLYLCGRHFIPTHNTEIEVNVLGYTMEHVGGPIMTCLPAETSMKKWINQKLTPMLEETPAINALLTSTATRDSSNTREFKDYQGGQLYIEHAGSPARLKSTSVRTLLVDEVDQFAAAFTGASGGDDPMDMLEGRTSAFPYTYKRIFIGTPEIKGVSRLEAKWDESSQAKYHVACPHCDHEQPLEWAGLQWAIVPGTKDDIAWARYVCRDCGAHIDEHHKTAMIRAGRWVHAQPGKRIRGYRANCLYYQPGLGPDWPELARMWLRAQNDPAKLKTFVNDRLAEAWEDPAMRAVRHNIIADRAEPYALRSAPAGVLVITAGVDTQDNRLAVHIVGWGRGMTAWTLDYIELPGDPADEAVWISLVDLLNRGIEARIETPEGPAIAVLPVQATLIDAGGHRTEAVKNFVRARRIRRPLAIFGAVPNNAPVLSKGKLVDIEWRGKLDKRGITIHHVGTVGIKHALYGRLSTDAEREPEKRLVRFSDQLEPSFFSGLVSETYNPTRNRFEKKRGARNEPLDTWVYAYAATHHPELRLHTWKGRDWDAAEQRLRAGAVLIDASGNPIQPVQVRPAPTADQAALAAPAAPAAKRAARRTQQIASDDWSSRL